MKTIGPESTYLVYIVDDVGMLIRPDQCQAIVRGRFGWRPVGDVQCLPVESQVLAIETATPVALALRLYEQETGDLDLRSLLTGATPFQQALASGTSVVPQQATEGRIEPL